MVENIRLNFTPIVSVMRRDLTLREASAGLRYYRHTSGTLLCPFDFAYLQWDASGMAMSCLNTKESLGWTDSTPYKYLGCGLPG